jgi:hypothetical protein
MDQPIDRLMTIVPVIACSNALNCTQDSHPASLTLPLLQLPQDRHHFPDGDRARVQGCGLHPDRSASREPPGRQRSSYPRVAGRIQGVREAPLLKHARAAGSSIQIARGAADGPRGDRGGAPARGRVGRTRRARVLRPDQLRQVPEEGAEMLRATQERSGPKACEA